MAIFHFLQITMLFAPPLTHTILRSACCFSHFQYLTCFFPLCSLPIFCKSMAICHKSQINLLLSLCLQRFFSCKACFFLLFVILPCFIFCQTFFVQAISMSFSLFCDFAMLCTLQDQLSPYLKHGRIANSGKQLALLPNSHNTKAGSVTPPQFRRG